MSLLVLALLAVVAFVLAVAASGLPRLRGGDLPPRARRASRIVASWRLAGTLVGLAVAAWSLHADTLGRGLLLAAPLFALCVLGGVVVGELLVTAPAGPVREAPLTVRRWHSYLPPKLTAAVAAGGGVLAVLLVAATLAGSPDDLGRAGRSLVHRCSPVLSQGHGPWPGSFYSRPLAVVVAAGLLLAGLAVVRIARRPSQGEDSAVEDALRRRSAAAVTAAAGLLVSVPLIGVSATAGLALRGIDCRPVLWSVLSWGLIALLPLALALAARCLAVLLVPSIRDPWRMTTPAGR